jgi:hypothetical protein
MVPAFSSTPFGVSQWSNGDGSPSRISLQIAGVDQGDDADTPEARAKMEKYATDAYAAITPMSTCAARSRVHAAKTMSLFNRSLPVFASVSSRDEALYEPLRNCIA